LTPNWLKNCANSDNRIDAQYMPVRRKGFFDTLGNQFQKWHLIAIYMRGI